MPQLSLNLLVSWLSLLAALTAAQQTSNCPNTLAVYNFNQRTTCMNDTYFIVPVDTARVAAAVFPYKLLPLPLSDTSLFPNGFPAGKFPVVLTIGLSSDIRMGQLQLPRPLYQGSIVVPYVDRLRDGKTPFRFSVRQYLGGVNNDNVNAAIPIIVGSAGGTLISLANFVPNSGLAYQQISPSPNEYIAQIKKVGLPNDFSGPGIYPEAADTDFFTVNTPGYPLKLFKQGINQPLILFNLLCQRNPVYFNETFTDLVYRNGKVTLSEPGGAFQGIYNNVAGFSGSGGNIGFLQEDCRTAAAKNDPGAF